MDSVEKERAKIVAIVKAKHKQKEIDKKLEQELRKKRK